MDRRKRKNDRPDIRPSDKVKKCLFGKADEHEKEERRRDEQETWSRNLENMRVKYGYDFVEDKHLHLENTPYTVAKVIKASYEKDLNREASSVANVQTPSEPSTTTPIKQCLDEYDSKSEPSNSNLVNGTLNEGTQNGERNCTCENDKAFVESDRQSLDIAVDVVNNYL